MFNYKIKNLRITEFVDKENDEYQEITTDFEYIISTAYESLYDMIVDIRKNQINTNKELNELRKPFYKKLWSKLTKPIYIRKKLK